MLLGLQVIVFGFSIWFGFYLLARDAAKPGLRYAGFGLVAYALGLGLDALGARLPDSSEVIDLLRWPLLFLPALFWFGAMAHLLPQDLPNRLRDWLDTGLLTITTGLYLIALLTDTPQNPNLIYWLLVGGVELLLMVGLYFAWQAFRSGLPKRPMSLVLVVSLFFALGMGMILLPQIDWLSPETELLAISLDLIFLGFAIVGLDAFDEGEALLPDVLRSLGFSAFGALLFGGQAALIMVITETVSPQMVLLLLALIMTAVATQTFADPLQNALDRLVFARFPRKGQERAQLRAVANAVPRVDESLDLLALPDDEFARLTRKALRYYGDLNRLAASPLTRLPSVDAQLRAANNDDNTLERAAILKALLTTSIERLKPRDSNDFGTTDEWRYYNALYFPYVAGLKPYSRRADYDDLDAVTQAALNWFQTYVPERTLYNWQNAAAKLVAQDLRESLAADPVR